MRSLGMKVSSNVCEVTIFQLSKNFGNVHFQEWAIMNLYLSLQN